MLWVITDTHFEHRAMIKNCGRPVNFTTLICEHWRQQISQKDTVIHLGDCAWNEDGMQRLLKLPGKKILVRGNHDSKFLEKYMEMGWNFACDSIVMKLQGMTILFSHHPQWNHRADINIHGHFHDLHREDFSRLYLPLSIEAMGYEPIALDEVFLRTISSWVDKRKIPKLKEIYDLKQNHQPLSLRDVYGAQTREQFMKKFLRHAAGEEDLGEAMDLDIDAVLKTYGAAVVDDFLKAE